MVERVPNSSPTKCPIIVLLVVAFLLTPVTTFAADIPSVDSLNLKPETLESLLGKKRLVFQHPETSHTIRGETYNFRYLTNVIVVNQPPSDVRELVTDYESYDDYFSDIHQSTIQTREGAETVVSFNETLRFAVIEPTITYSLKFRELDDGDVIFSRESGDFQLYQGRWKFVPLDEDRTLLVLTSRMDPSGVSWRGDMVLWAQPDLKRTLPIVRGTGFVDRFRILAEDSTDTDPASDLPEEPEIPVSFDESSNREALKTLTQQGTTIFVHPDQRFSHSGESTRLVFITTFELVQGPIDQARHYLTRFEEVPQFIDQLESVDTEDTENGFIADWYFDMGFGLFSVPVEYKTRYTWEEKNRLTYERMSGDLDPIYGAYEWTSVIEDETLYAFTAASRLSEDASKMVKLGQTLKHPQIFMGLSLGAIGVENGVNWTNEQIANSQ